MMRGKAIHELQVGSLVRQYLETIIVFQKYGILILTLRGGDNADRTHSR